MNGYISENTLNMVDAAVKKLREGFAGEPIDFGELGDLIETVEDTKV